MFDVVVVDWFGYEKYWHVDPILVRDSGISIVTYLLVLLVIDVVVDVVSIYVDLPSFLEWSQYPIPSGSAVVMMMMMMRTTTTLSKHSVVVPVLLLVVVILLWTRVIPIAPSVVPTIVLSSNNKGMASDQSDRRRPY